MAFFSRLLTITTSSAPEARPSSTTYWMAGRSTTSSISGLGLGSRQKAGTEPPAAGMSAFLSSSAFLFVVRVPPMILQMTRASLLSFVEFAILSPMSKTDAHSLDPIPDEQSRRRTTPPRANRPACAFSTPSSTSRPTAAACQAAFEEARALCCRYERLFSRTLPPPRHRTHQQRARPARGHRPFDLRPAREGAFLLRGKRGRLRHYRRPGGAPVEFSRGHGAR